MTVNSKLLDGIVIFVEVINAGSFTKTADNTGHSTSYISKEISKLEDRLGTRLINRTTRSISLTPEGELFFQQCQQIVEDAQSAELSINQKQQDPKGTLKISCPTSFSLPHLNAVFTTFLTAYPKINLVLDVSGKKVDVVADGFDVVIRATQTLEDSSLISRLLINSHGVTVASPQYLAEYGTPKHPSELSQHKIINYSYAKNPKTWHYTAKNGEKIAVPIESRVMANNSEMEIALVTAGQGITRMPKFNLSDKLASGELVTLFDGYELMPINIYLVYASRKHMSAKVRCFIDFAIKELAPLNASPLT